MDFKQLKGLPPVGYAATAAALPASVKRTTLYYVEADENNKNGAGVAQPSIYILNGTAKIWSQMSSVVRSMLLARLQIIGANQGETDQNTLENVTGLGLRIGGNAVFNYGGITSQGNMNVWADQNLFIRGNKKWSLFSNSLGWSVNRDTNDARAGFDVGGDAIIDALKVGSIVTLAPTKVTIAPTQAALFAAIAAATTPTVITWTGVIPLTADLELRYKSNLELNCYNQGGLSRADSPSMVIIRGDLVNCAIRGIDFTNTNTSGSNGSIIRFNEQGPVDGLYIESNTFLNAGTDNNAISANSSGGASDQFITSHKNVHIKRNKFGGNVGTGSGISRMAIEVTNHSADGAGPVQFCEGFYIEHNEIYKCGTGSNDGFGISVSGLFRKGRVADNVIVDAKRYSLEGVAISDFVIERNVVIDIDNTSNGLSLSNGYKGAGAWPDGTMERVIVKDNTFDVKGRAIMAYYFNNCQFTSNTGTSLQRNEFIGNEYTLTNNTFVVTNDWNALYFAKSSRNRLVGNKCTTVYHGGGVYTSSVIFFDTDANNSYLRKNILTRPSGSYNVHIEQASGVSNDTGAAAGSATNTVNTYAEK